MQSQIHFCCRWPASVVGLDDAWFSYDHAHTAHQDLVEVSAEIAALPEVAGFGSVHSLRQAMARRAANDYLAGRPYEAAHAFAL